MGKLLNKLKKAWKNSKSAVKEGFENIGNVFEKMFGENENKGYVTDSGILANLDPVGGTLMPTDQIEEMEKNGELNSEDVIKNEDIGITNPQENINQGGIIDTTDQNIESAVNGGFTMDDYKSLRNEQWAREDQIRREVQMREDTAYQRAAEDARKAGINMNLLGINPAASGGGITNATGIDTSLEEMDLEKSLTELENYLERELKADEGQKDRIMDLITTAIMFFAFKKF